MSELEIAKLKKKIERLQEATDWLLGEYHFLSRKMTEINNVVTPLWRRLRERRNDYQLIEKFIEEIETKGLDQALSATPTAAQAGSDEAKTEQGGIDSPQKESR